MQKLPLPSFLLNSVLFFIHNIIWMTLYCCSVLKAKRDFTKEQVWIVRLDIHQHFLILAWIWMFWVFYRNDRRLNVFMAFIIFCTFRFYNVFPPFLMDLSYFIYFYYASSEAFLVFYKSNFLKRLFLLSATFLKIELLVFVKIKVKVFILFYCYTTSNVQQENKWKLSVTLDVLHTYIHTYR